MAFRTSGKASPNLPSKYRSTPSGSMGVDSTTARTPWSVFTAGKARPRSSTRNSSPRSRSRTFLSSFGVGLKMPNRWPLLCAFRPASAFPRDNASSCLNPNRSATNEAHSVNTGARLIRILFAVMVVSICSVIQSGIAGSRSQRHPDRIGDLKFMAGEITASARPFGPGVSIRVQSHAGDFESLAPLLKLRSAVGRAHCAQIGKQGPCGRQRAEDFSHFVAEMDQWRLDGTALTLFAVMIGVFVDPGYRPAVPCGPCFKKVSTPPGISLDKAELALLRNVEKAGVYGIRIWELLNRVADEQNPATRAETRALRLKLWQNLRKLLSRGVVFRRARRWISVYRLPRASVNRPGGRSLPLARQAPHQADALLDRRRPPPGRESRHRPGRLERKGQRSICSELGGGGCRIQRALRRQDQRLVGGRLLRAHRLRRTTVAHARQGSQGGQPARHHRPQQSRDELRQLLDRLRRFHHRRGQ